MKSCPNFMMNSISASSFFQLGYSMISSSKVCREMTTHAERVFRTYFGVSPVVASKCWNMMVSGLYDGCFNCNFEPKHLLWALMLLKMYSLEPVHAGIAHCSVKTFRKWSLSMVEAIASMLSDVVSRSHLNAV